MAVERSLGLLPLHRGCERPRERRLGEKRRDAREIGLWGLCKDGGAEGIKGIVKAHQEDVLELLIVDFDAQSVQLRASSGEGLDVERNRLSGADLATRGYLCTSWSKVPSEADRRLAWHRYCLDHHTHPERLRPPPSLPSPPPSPQPDHVLPSTPSSPGLPDATPHVAAPSTSPSPRRIAIELAIAQKNQARASAYCHPRGRTSSTAATPAPLTPNRESVDGAGRMTRVDVSPPPRTVPEQIRYFAVRGDGAGRILYTSRYVVYHIK
ncbi:hypothetical protein PLICRDRAFT_174428 [Plicaturopsis crispa FD-325 SS-3]|nr:hypothetical protein PLICRDRAFT_174428 [Plicaturopsis crispa FD-325 SS-3]